jgi:hypothetical protein
MRIPFVANVLAPVPPLVTPRAVPRLRPENDGAALVLIFWIVFTDPLRTVKLPVLNDASPLIDELASWIVILLPDVAKLDGDVVPIVSAPTKPLTLETPPEPGHAWKVGAPELFPTRQYPSVASFETATAEVPLPNCSC